MKFSIITPCYNQLENLKKQKAAWEAQTLNHADFEWILADDGSNDGTHEWAIANGITIVGNKINGNYDWNLYNRAAKRAHGTYLTWVMGDSYPKEDYLEQLSKLVSLFRLVNGVRINVKPDGKIVSIDWRVKGMSDEADMVKVDWRVMTLNSLCMPRIFYEKIYGFYGGYKGYGRADIELIYRAARENLEMWFALKAIVYHLDHEARQENPMNVRIFENRLKNV